MVLNILYNNIGMYIIVGMRKTIFKYLSILFTFYIKSEF